MIWIDPPRMIIVIIATLVIGFLSSYLLQRANREAARRANAGIELARGSFFDDMAYLYLTDVTSMARLYDTIRKIAPDVTVLEEGDRVLYFNGSRWSAKLERMDNLPTLIQGKPAYRFAFPDCKTSLLPQRNFETREQMNMMLTTIEKAFLTLDPFTVVNVRYATSQERSIDVDLGNDSESYESLVDISQWLTDKSIELARDVAQKSGQQMQKNSASYSMANRLDLLILYYVNTPALPESCTAAAQTVLAL